MTAAPPSPSETAEPKEKPAPPLPAMPSEVIFLKSFFAALVAAGESPPIRREDALQQR